MTWLCSLWLYNISFWECTCFVFTDPLWYLFCWDKVFKVVVWMKLGYNQPPSKFWGCRLCFTISIGSLYGWLQTCGFLRMACSLCLPMSWHQSWRACCPAYKLCKGTGVLHTLETLEGLSEKHLLPVFSLFEKWNALCISNRVFWFCFLRQGFLYSPGWLSLELTL